MNIEAAVDRLQKRCSQVAGKDVLFRMHAWGAHANHQDNPFHKHSYAELCYIFSGSGMYWENGRDYPLEPGMFLLTRPETVHRIFNCRNMFIMWVGFDVDALSSSREGIRWFEEFLRSGKITLPAIGTPAALLAEALLKQAEYPAPADVLLPVAYSFLLAVQAQFCERKESESMSDEQTRGQLLVKQAQLFIRDNLDQPLSLASVAAFFHVSPRHLSRLFSRHGGTSYTSFVRQARVREAARDLENSSISIQMIADQYGFSSVHYFTKVFQEETGLTPARYRKQHRQNKQVNGDNR